MKEETGISRLLQNPENNSVWEFTGCFNYLQSNSSHDIWIEGQETQDNTLPNFCESSLSVCLILEFG